MRIGITGHRLLGDGVAQQAIREKLENVLKERARPGDEALSGMAIGADQIFAELALEAGLRLHAVIACQGYEATFAPGDELRGYEVLLAKSSQTTTMDFAAPSEAAFEASGHWIVDHCDIMVAVWDGKPAKGRGGTGDVVAYAEKKAVPTIIVPSS
jgi:hypothetical protein